MFDDVFRLTIEVVVVVADIVNGSTCTQIPFINMQVAIGNITKFVHVDH